MDGLFLIGRKGHAERGSETRKSEAGSGYPQQNDRRGMMADRKAGSMYIAIDGDTNPFEKAMGELRAKAKTQGNEVAHIFGVSFEDPIKKTFANLNRSVAETLGSLSLKKIELPTDQIKEMAKQLEISEDTYKNLAERMIESDTMQRVEKNFTKIAKSANLTEQEMKDLAKEMGMTDAQFKSISTSIKLADSRMSAFKNTSEEALARLAKRAAAGVLSIAAIKRGFDTVISSLREVSDVGDKARATGMLVEDFSRLSYIAERSGVSVDAFARSWQNMQKSINEARNKTGEQLKAFSRLNIDFKELTELAPEKQFSAIADSIGKLNTEGEKIKVIDTLFGKGGRELLPLLSQGSAGVEKLSAQFKDLGLGIAQLDVIKAKQATEAMDRLKSSWSKLKIEISTAAAPWIADLADNLTKFVQHSRVASKQWDLENIKTYETEVEKLRKNLEEFPRAVFWVDKWKSDISELTVRIAKLKASTGAFDNIVDNWEIMHRKLQEKPLTVDIDIDNDKILHIRDNLSEQIAYIRAAGDQTKIWEIEYQKLLKTIGDDSIGKKFLKTLDGLKRSEIEYQKMVEASNEALRERIEFESWLERESKSIAADAKARADFWKQMGITSVDAINDITAAISDQADELRRLGIPQEYIQQWKNLQEVVRDPNDWMKGLKDGLQDYAKSIGDLQSNMKSLTVNTFSNMEDALVSFVSKGKLDFSSMVDSFIADLARLAIRQAVMAPLVGGIGSIFSGTQHTGGIVGHETAFTQVSPLAFLGVERYHTGGVVGLKPNEVPIIAKRGEGVFTPEQMRALGTEQSTNVNVQVVNNTSSNVAIRQQYNGNGGVDIIAQIDDAMAAVASKKGSRFNRQMHTTGQLVRR